MLQPAVRDSSRQPIAIFLGLGLGRRTACEHNWELKGELADQVPQLEEVRLPMVEPADALWVHVLQGPQHILDQTVNLEPDVHNL